MDIADRLEMNASRIYQIIDDCEAIQEDRYESTYHKQYAKIAAYNDIVELLRGGHDDNMEE